MTTDKQDARLETFVLSGWQVLEASGADATTFLQAQTMNDLRSLQPGQWQWNGWLNPKGRLIALFALARLDPQRYWLLVPDFPAAELASRLQRFVFRSKVKLAVRDDLRASGAFGGFARAQGASFHCAVDGDLQCLTFDLGDGHTTRSLFIGTRVRDDMTAADPPATSDDEGLRKWLAFDLAHGLPRLPMDQSEQWTPQMLSLQRLHAFSLKKGCYPGQEIVARTHFLGQAKRELVRIAGAGLVPAAEVMADGSILGTVLVASDDRALAVLAVERPAAGWICAGLPCHERPLLDGLAR